MVVGNKILDLVSRDLRDSNLAYDVCDSLFGSNFFRIFDTDREALLSTSFFQIRLIVLQLLLLPADEAELRSALGHVFFTSYDTIGPRSGCP